MKNYLPLKSKSSKLGDEYYRCLSQTLSSPMPPSLEQCLELGRQYQAALREQLNDLQRLTDRGFVEREKKLITDYLALVDHDLLSLNEGDVERIRDKPRRSSQH